MGEIWRKQLYITVVVFGGGGLGLSRCHHLTLVEGKVIASGTRGDPVSVLCPHVAHHLFSPMLGWISDPTQFKAEVLRGGKMGIGEDIMHCKERSELRVTDDEDLVLHL